MHHKNILLIILALFIFHYALHSENITDWAKQHNEISKSAYAECNRNKAKLIAANLWPYQRPAAVVYLRNPIAAMPGMYDYGFYHVPYCVDLLPGPGISDWRCTFNEDYTKTFDGCTGTVFEVVPRGYQPMLSKVAKVVAAADGVILAKADGNNDQNCYSTSSNSNYVVLEHGDGSRTYYYDLKNGGITQQPIGSYISAGEVIGYPGGSGNIGQLNAEHETHLLFELRDNSNNVIDPFESQGCLGLPKYSNRWIDPIAMRNYVNNSELLLLKTCKRKASGIDNCGMDIKSYTLHFNPGDSMYIELGFKNYDNNALGDSFLINIFNPVGVPIINTIVRKKGCVTCQSIPFLNYLQGVKLPSGILMIPGTYTITLTYYWSYGITLNYKHYISVGCQPDYTLTNTVTDESGAIAGNNIYSSQTLNSGSRVKLISGSRVTLLPGFRARAGSKVMIFNDPCIVPAF